MTITYKTKSGATQFKPTIGALEEMVEDQEGFCLACGNTQDGVEPDARKYECDSCGAPKVYGAEELILMNLFY